MLNINGKNYQVIISDFDGTLAGKDKVISKPVKEAIGKLKEVGVAFIIASGRNYWGIVQDTCKELNLTQPQITCGGGEIVDPQTENVLSAEYISDKDLDGLFKLLTETKIDFWMEKDFEIYTFDKKEHDSFGPSQYRELRDIELTRIPKTGIFTINDSKLGEEIEQELTDKFKDLHITRSFSPVGRTWDITASMGNKQEAVLKVSKMLNIKPEEIIGIGDGYNDFPLLEACGYGVAMGNAHDELKAIADEIVPSYLDNGVATFVNSLII